MQLIRGRGVIETKCSTRAERAEPVRLAALGGGQWLVGGPQRPILTDGAAEGDGLGGGGVEQAFGSGRVLHHHVLSVLGVLAVRHERRLAQRRESRAGGDEEEGSTEGITAAFFRVERLAEGGQHRTEAGGVDEWEQRDRLPLELFPVEVVLEIDRVKVDEGRLGVYHEAAIGLR